MAAGVSGEAIASARLDREGRLLSADPRLLAINARAGGALGEPLALPQVATLAILAGKLGIRVSRSALVSDGEREWTVSVDAREESGEIALEIADWNAQDPYLPKLADLPGDPAELGAEGAWRWETDRALALVRLALDTPSPSRFDGERLIGAPLTRLFALEEEDDGSLPMLSAVAADKPFENQKAIVRQAGLTVTLSGEPMRDTAGRLLGYRGTAVPRRDDAAEEAGLLSAPGLAEEIGRALRRPLASIAANAEAIGNRTQGPLRADYVGYAGDISTAARHLLALVDDLADLEAVERPDLAVEREVIDLTDVARRAAGLLAVRAGGRRVRIDAPAADDVLSARGDFRRTLQILVNLIGNAVRYSPEGAMVWIRTEREGDLATIIVADQGRGIAREDQARIFEKFARLDPSEPGGSGLGLYIARRFARAMGGDITVDSAPGQGARFALTLPGA